MNPYGILIGVRCFMHECQRQERLGFGYLSLLQLLSLKLQSNRCDDVSSPLIGTVKTSCFYGSDVFILLKSKSCVRIGTLLKYTNSKTEQCCDTSCIKIASHENALIGLLDQIGDLHRVAEILKVVFPWKIETRQLTHFALEKVPKKRQSWGRGCIELKQRFPKISADATGRKSHEENFRTLILTKSAVRVSN